MLSNISTSAHIYEVYKQVLDVFLSLTTAPSAPRFVQFYDLPGFTGEEPISHSEM